MADQQTKVNFSYSFMLLTVIAMIAVSSIAKPHMRNNAAVGVGVCTVVPIVVARLRWELR